MSSIGSSFIAMQKLIRQSIWRWRWRLLTEAVLVAIATLAFIGYSAYLEHNDTTFTVQVEPLQTPYFDVMLRLLPDQRPLDREELPVPRYQREVYGYSEMAEITMVSGSWGITEMIGLSPESTFFSFSEDELLGRGIQATHEILMPRDLADTFGLELGQEISVAFLHPVTSSDVRVFSRERTTHFEAISSGQAWRAARELHNTTRTMRLVGIYQGKGFFTPLVGRFDDLMDIDKSEYANTYLINYDRETSQLSHLVEWMNDAYPGAMLYSETTPQSLGRSMNQQNRASMEGLSGYVLLFMGIALYTITLMTFLERRGEIASYKTIGLSNGQFILIFFMETYTPALIGSLAGGALAWAAAPHLSFMGSLDAALFIHLFLTVFALTCLIIVVAALFPLLTTRVASVIQLLHARIIPLWHNRVHYMEHGSPIEIYRERLENLRFLKLPVDEEEGSDILFFKQLGDSVKEGEVIAQLHLYFGYSLKEWLAPCDGTIVDLDVSGLIAIKPDNENTPFHPYPKQLLEKGQQHYERLPESARH